jgi:hypothetical protein
LLENGLSKDRLDNHVKNGRLRKLARGVFCHRYARLSWQSLVASFGQSIPVAAYVGGLSALREAGFAQYLSFGSKSTLEIYSPSPKPHWLKTVFGQLDNEVSVNWHRTQRLWPDLTGLDFLQNQPGFSQPSGAQLMMASPERAFLELLEEVPKKVSFDHADEIMQGLMNLSPRKLDTLINSCNSVKAKRLFCWLAERHQHSWWKKLDYQSFDLGSGKRVVEQGGRLDSRYQITVPSHMHRTYVTQEEAIQ